MHTRCSTGSCRRRVRWNCRAWEGSSPAKDGLQYTTVEPSSSGTSGHWVGPVMAVVHCGGRTVRRLSRLFTRNTAFHASTNAAPRPGWRRQVRPFVAGILVGVLFVLGGIEVINRSDWPDAIVQPLLPPDTAGPADAIVVLGAGILGPCVPNYNALRRSVLAAKLW